MLSEFCVLATFNLAWLALNWKASRASFQTPSLVKANKKTLEQPEEEEASIS